MEAIVRCDVFYQAVDYLVIWLDVVMFSWRCL